MFSSCCQIHHGYLKESNSKADRKCEDERNEMEVNDRKTHWVKPFLAHLEFNVTGFLYSLLQPGLAGQRQRDLLCRLQSVGH